jgi:DnaJ-class molecular chaperone
VSNDRQIDFDPTVDYYKALGVDAKATTDDIKKAYRKLAKQFHPDTTGGDKAKESRFKEISNAYEVLGDTKKRGQYDQLREYARSGGGMSGFGGFAGSGGRGGAPGAGFAGGQVFDLNDLFGQFFGGRQGGPGGRVRVERVDFDPEHRSRPAAEDAEFESKVRASDGSWLGVKGVDVTSEVRIPFERANLGTVAEVATVDGKATVKIPPGTSSGKKLRLRGKGVTDGSRVGDHYITVQIDVPSGADLDDDARRQVIELAGKLKKPPKK